MSGAAVNGKSAGSHPPPAHTHIDGSSSHDQQPSTQTSSTAVAQRPPAVLGTPWFWALVCSPIIILIGCVLRGVVLHQPHLLYRSASSKNHALQWFDRHIFRTIGPLLPMTAWCMRELLYKYSSLRPWFYPRGGALMLYVQVIVVRLVIYLGHLKIQPLVGGRNLISDHIVLGASIVACLTLEFGCAVTDAIAAASTRDKTSKRWPLLAAFAIVGWTALLLYCTSVNMFFTARFYHKQDESIRGLVVGMGFLVPTLAAFSRVQRARLWMRY